MKAFRSTVWFCFLFFRSISLLWFRVQIFCLSIVLMESTGVFVQTPLLKSAQTVILKHSGHSLCKKALSVDESRPFLWSFVSESFGHCYFQIQCLDFFFLFQWFFILFYFLHCAFEPSEAFKGLSMKPLKAPCYNPWHDIQWSAGPEGNLKLCEGSLSTSVFTASPPPPLLRLVLKALPLPLRGAGLCSTSVIGTSAARREQLTHFPT